MDTLEIKPQEGPQTEFLSTKADIAIFGGGAGGGKSVGLLIEPLRHIYLKYFSAVFFRRTYKQFTNPGGLWDESQRIYPLFGAIPREVDLSYKFPSGMKLVMSHLQYDSTVNNFQGSQIPLMLWDELTHFSEYQFFYMLSRNRSTTGVPGYVRATCNPDPDSWVAEFLSWWIGEDGYPISSRSGILRWFIRVNGDTIIWGDSKQELIEKYGGGSRFVRPKSITFIPSTVYDNKILLEKDPDYLANLQALPEVEQARLLGGNWKIDYAGGGIFNRDWFRIVDDQNIPSGGIECRYWDFAATKKDKKRRSHDPDHTAGVKIRYVNGKYYVTDVISLQLDPSEVEELFQTVTSADVQQARNSNSQYLSRWETEPGSAGKRETYRLVQSLPGVDCQGVPSVGDKITRAKPFASQARIANVFVRRASWNKPYLNHLHRQPNALHDDMMDATSGAERAIAVELSSRSHKRGKSSKLRSRTY